MPHSLRELERGRVAPGCQAWQGLGRCCPAAGAPPEPGTGGGGVGGLAGRWGHGRTHGYPLPPGPSKHQSAVTCLQFSSKFVVTSSDDGTVKLWDLKTGEFVRNLVALESGGSGGVVWRIRASNTKLVCAVGSRNGTEETKLLVLDFDVDLK